MRLVLRSWSVSSTPAAGPTQAKKARLTERSSKHSSRRRRPFSDPSILTSENMKLFVPHTREGAENTYRCANRFSGHVATVIAETPLIAMLHFETELGVICTDCDLITQ